MNAIKSHLDGRYDDGNAERDADATVSEATNGLATFPVEAGRTTLPTAAAVAGGGAGGDICSRLPVLVRFHVKDVIYTSLPLEETDACREAWQRDADLVLTESDPLDFVRYCHYDLWAGARRLCLYWAERKRLFGPRRAFLPLVLTGTGALDPQDVVTVLSGAFCILPDTTKGQQCMLIDRRRLLPGAPYITRENRQRRFFYLFHILLERRRNQGAAASLPTLENTTNDDDNAVLVFMVLVTPRDYGVDWNFMRSALSFSLSIFPLPFRFRLLCIPHKNKLGMASYIVQGVASLVRQFYGRERIDVEVHVQTEPNRILREMLAMGCEKRGIPSFLGGAWEFQYFFDWCQQRKVWEIEVYKDKLQLLQQQEPQSQTSRANMAAAATAAAAPPSPTLPVDASEEETEENKGLMTMNNVFHTGHYAEQRENQKQPATSRRTRIKKSAKTRAAAAARVKETSSRSEGNSYTYAAASASSQINNATTSRDGDHAEGETAKGAMGDTVLSPVAAAAATMIEESLRQEDRLAKRRMADLFHSRRKRERKKQLVSTLQSEHRQLVEEQFVLRAEHERLQILFHKAQQELAKIAG
ncbi:hypothetical protein ACA910_015897 [Epithemia clementina (nom. ined.)]